MARQLIVAARAFAQQRHARYIIVRSYTPMIAAALLRTISVRVAQRMNYAISLRRPSRVKPAGKQIPRMAMSHGVLAPRWDA